MSEEIYKRMIRREFKMSKKTITILVVIAVIVVLAAAGVGIHHMMKGM